MSRETRLARTVRRAVDRRLESIRESSKASRKTIFLKVVLYLFGVPSLIVGLLQLVPRISVSPQTPLISSNAFSAPFLVSNDGYVSLYEVTAACAAKDVLYVDPQRPNHKLTLEWEGGDETETGGILSPEVAHKIPAPGRVAFHCALLNLPVSGEWVRCAQILLIIKYHAPLLPFIDRHYRQRFELVRDSTGQLRWLEEPSKG
jgi:hypothetical protein